MFIRYLLLLNIVSTVCLGWVRVSFRVMVIVLFMVLFMRKVFGVLLVSLLMFLVD